MPIEFPCVTINTPSNTAALIAMAVTDIVLLLIMFVGLLRLRAQGGGGSTFGLARLLWKQVRRLFSLIDRGHFGLWDIFFQGVIWISLATIAEVPPAVCSL
jgi:hypothetical protein